MEKSLITFFLLFNDLKYGTNSLFCCNGYSHAIFKKKNSESQVEELIQAFKQKKKRT